MAVLSWNEIKTRADAFVSEWQDKAVNAAYGRSFADDSERVAYLFELYQKLSGELFRDEKKRGKGRKA
ncbi:MAG: hypothetical protein LBG73_09975 [Spirochaetaceae bacterium]|jgi:hypothetical protein|nr:hypothetical protein [Spirochaetaceae bacterium]